MKYTRSRAPLELYLKPPAAPFGRSSEAVLRISILHPVHFGMEVMAAVAAWALQSACQNASSYGWLSGLCAPIIDVAALSASLSEGAHVYLPSSPEFEVATARWSAGYTPDVRVVVVPAVEADVAATVSQRHQEDTKSTCPVLRMHCYDTSGSCWPR